MLDFLAVGDVMLDVHAPAPHAHGGRLHAPIVAAAGGSAVNAAFAAAELGASAGVAGAIGDDGTGRGIREELERHGVDDLLITVPGATGTTLYIGGAVIADRAANTAFAPADLPEAGITLISGYLDAAQLQTALAGARGLRAVDLQGNHHELPHLDVVIGPGIDLGAYDARIVCSTLGAGGAVASEGGEHVSAPAPLAAPGPLRGAGDRFAARFLLGVGRGEPLQACLAAACAFAGRPPST